ncbi:MAG: hypothetical protein HHAS10_12220 [Candidatus Altimarinota bacterium]
MNIKQKTAMMFSRRKSDLGKELLDELNLINSYFSELIISSGFCLDQVNSITWGNYERGISSQFYTQEYMNLVNKRQYSFLLKENKGFIQFFFSTDGNVITKGKMAFYPYPVEVNIELNDIEELLMSSDDDILGEHLINIHELLDSEISGSNLDNEESIAYKYLKKYPITNSSHLRVDYSPGVSSHQICEMQMGGINTVRLPFAVFIRPFIFFSFIVKNIFPEEYKNLKTHKSDPIDKLIQSHKKKSLFIKDFKEENFYFTHI